MNKLILLVLLTLSNYCFSQTLKITYLYNMPKLKMTDSLFLYSSADSSQFIFDIKEKKIALDFDDAQGVRHANKFTLNYNFKTRKYYQFKKFKGRVFYTNWIESDNNWTITNEKDSILGFKVVKAYKEIESKYLVRQKVYAWFAPDIPVSTGPLYFTQLPGLILKITYEKNSLTIVAINNEYIYNHIFISEPENSIFVEKDIMLDNDEVEMNKRLKDK